MANIPAEVAGKVLSRMPDARQAVSASAVSRTWRQAFLEHLSVLCFPDYAREQENEITGTILQTSAVKSLLVTHSFHRHLVRFSAEAVRAWLQHTRNKLEELTLSFSTIGQVDTLPCLRSLVFFAVLICLPDLNALLAGCPMLESLELVATRFDQEKNNDVSKLELCAPNLRRFRMERMTLEKLFIQSVNLEELSLIDGVLESFKFIGNIRNITMTRVYVRDLELGDSVAECVETVELSGTRIPASKLYCVLSNSSSQLRRLVLRNVTGVEGGHYNENVFPYCVQGSKCFESLVWLTVEGLRLSNEEIQDLVKATFAQCPILEKLEFDGRIWDRSQIMEN